MNRTLTNCQFTIADPGLTKQQVLNFATRFGTFCFLDNHQYGFAPQVREYILAAEPIRHFSSPAGRALAGLQDFIDQTKGWLFGHLGYDLKNEIEALHSAHPDYLGFPDLFFFEPKHVVQLSGQGLLIEGEDASTTYEQILAAGSGSRMKSRRPVRLQHRFSREEYISTVRRLQEHIRRGDCYEVNFCQEFFAWQAEIDPVEVYERLSRVSPNPFSALYKLGDKWLICASPERFLRRDGGHIISQPIKGTSRRDPKDRARDEMNRQELQASPKERSENVMVVDLVRNDLARVCREGTVRVEELFGVYSFPQVHQLVSTVGGELKEGVSFAEILRACFPMGSMTGAPKKKVMELIERYERTRRGIFSGALGYIRPGQHEFDFNVVIRSIMYDAAGKYLSFQVGSGITFYSDPEKEWEECLLKAAAIEEVLGSKVF